MDRRRAIASFAVASMAKCGVSIDFPTKETSIGSWLESTGGMCTAAQYSEVDGVILDLNSSYWGGWVEPMVLRVKSHNILTKLPGVASGVLR